MLVYAKLKVLRLSQPLDGDGSAHRQIVRNVTDGHEPMFRKSHDPALLLSGLDGFRNRGLVFPCSYQNPSSHWKIPEFFLCKQEGLVAGGASSSRVGHSR